MVNLGPHLRDGNDVKHILWEHLSSMSDVKLAVDYLDGGRRQEDLNQRPPRLPYRNTRISYRHYGELIERLIHKIGEMPEGEERDVLIRMVANQMKRAFMMWNKDTVDDQKIFDDLYLLSGKKVREIGRAHV